DGHVSMENSRHAPVPGTEASCSLDAGAADRDNAVATYGCHAIAPEAATTALAAGGKHAGAAIVHIAVTAGGKHTRAAGEAEDDVGPVPGGADGEDGALATAAGEGIDGFASGAACDSQATEEGAGNS